MKENSRKWLFFSIDNRTIVLYDIDKKGGTMSRIIFHIDVNSAYLSWTAIKLLRDGSETDLRKIPAIVGGDMSKRHGVVLAKSIAAARYGIRTGEPITDALRKCANLTIVPPEHHYYSQCSRQLLDLLHHYTSAISQYSIDSGPKRIPPTKASAIPQPCQQT